VTNGAAWDSFQATYDRDSSAFGFRYM